MTPLNTLKLALHTVSELINMAKRFLPANSELLKTLLQVDAAIQEALKVLSPLAVAELEQIKPDEAIA